MAISSEYTIVYSCLDNTNDLFEKVKLAAELEGDLRTVTEWGEKWLVSFSASKNKIISIDRSRDAYLPSILMDGVELPENSDICLLGLSFSKVFLWKAYIESVAKSAAMKVGSLYWSLKFLSPKSMLYLSAIRPCMEYCCHIWGGSLNSSSTC